MVFWEKTNSFQEILWFGHLPPIEQNLLDHEFHLKNPNLKLHLPSIFTQIVERKVIKSIEKAESLLSQHHARHILTNLLGCFTDHPEETELHIVKR